MPLAIWSLRDGGVVSPAISHSALAANVYSERRPVAVTVRPCDPVIHRPLVRMTELIDLEWIVVDHPPAAKVAANRVRRHRIVGRLEELPCGEIHRGVHRHDLDRRQHVALVAAIFTRIARPRRSRMPRSSRTRATAATARHVDEVTLRRCIGRARARLLFRYARCNSPGDMRMYNRFFAIIIPTRVAFWGVRERGGHADGTVSEELRERNLRRTGGAGSRLSFLDGTVARVGDHRVSQSRHREHAQLGRLLGCVHRSTIRTISASPGY